MPANYSVPLDVRIAHRARHAVRVKRAPLRWLRSRFRDFAHAVLGEWPEDYAAC